MRRLWNQVAWWLDVNPWVWYAVPLGCIGAVLVGFAVILLR